MSEEYSLEQRLDLFMRKNHFGKHEKRESPYELECNYLSTCRLVIKFIQMYRGWFVSILLLWYLHVNRSKRSSPKRSGRPLLLLCGSPWQRRSVSMAGKWRHVYSNVLPNSVIGQSRDPNLLQTPPLHSFRGLNAELLTVQSSILNSPLAVDNSHWILETKCNGTSSTN